MRMGTLRMPHEVFALAVNDIGVSGETVNDQNAPFHITSFAVFLG